MDGIICNPTNELLEPMHGGKTFIFPPGHTMQVPGPTANHILNEYGQRGLVQLNFGDDQPDSGVEKGKTKKEEKMAAGVRKNREYKARQVIAYNQDNENRANNKMPYVSPPENVRGYAKELAMKIIAPYAIPDDNQAAVNAVASERDDLKSMVNKLIEQNTALMAKLNGDNTVKTDLPTDQELKEKAMVDSFKTLSTIHLKKLINDQRAVIGTWPEHIKTQLRERYTKLTSEQLTI